MHVCAWLGVGATRFVSVLRAYFPLFLSLSVFFVCLNIGSVKVLRVMSYKLRLMSYELLIERAFDHVVVYEGSDRSSNQSQSIN